MKKVFMLFVLFACIPFVSNATEFESVRDLVVQHESENKIGGEMGDFLVKVPETAEIRQIADKEKNSMFLSVENPKQYAENGYCLIDVIPADVLKQKGWGESTCYRVFCGGPESMNYDGNYYSVSVCENDL